GRATQPGGSGHLTSIRSPASPGLSQQPCQPGLVRMWIPRSTPPPAGAGPSATSSGSIPRAWAIAGKNRIARSRSNRFSIETPLAVHRALVEIRARPTRLHFDLDRLTVLVLNQFIDLPPARLNQLRKVSLGS